MYTPFELFAPSTSFYYNPAAQEEEELYRRLRRGGYLAAAEEEAERRRRYQAALEERAYLQELERIRRQRAIEEEIERKRQAEILYRKELERRRRKKELEEQILMERKRCAATAALKAYENQQREERERIRTQRVPEYQLLQGPDGRIYRVMIQRPATHSSAVRNNNNNNNNNHYYYYPNHEEFEEAHKKIPVTTQNVYSMKTDSQNPIPMTPSSVSSSSSMEDDDDDDQHMMVDRVFPPLAKKHTNTSTGTPIFKNVVFNNCFNENRAPNTNDDDGQEVVKASKSQQQQHSKKSMKKNKKKKKQIQSSILIGVVEDASDSECEDEYKDFWHNRRPETSWMEPVDFFNVKSASTQ